MATEAGVKPYDKSAFDLAPDEAGIRLPDIANAVQIWSCLQPGRTTVAEAACAFNVTRDVILAAVDADYGMFLSGPSDDPGRQIIEHEGE